MAAHDPARPLLTMALFEAQEPSRCGIAELDGETRLIVGFEEKPAQPKSNLANAGLYVCRRPRCSIGSPDARRRPISARMCCRSSSGEMRGHSVCASRSSTSARRRVTTGRSARSPSGCDGLAVAQERPVIITQTPLRVSLAGGGTDLRDFYESRRRHVSSAIDKYIFVIVSERFDDRIYVELHRQGDRRLASTSCSTSWCARRCGMTRDEGGVEITMLADMPSRGHGPRLLEQPDGRPAQRALHFHAAGRCTPSSWPRRPAASRSRSAASRSASRTSTSPPTAGSKFMDASRRP